MALDPAWRKTPAGIKLGKFLFDAKYRQALQNNPTMLISLAQAAGIEIPKGVQVTAASMQLLVAGGAFVSNIEAGRNISQIAKSGAGTMQAAIALATITGLADASNPIVQDVRLGADLALVIAGGGTNVLADINLILDVSSMVEITKMQARQKAFGKMNAWMRARRQPQIKALQNNFKSYQEGNVDIFTLMGEVAEESPDYFQTFFPELQGFIPTYTFTHTERASKGGLFGTKRSSVTQIIETIKNDHKTITQGIILKYGGVALSVMHIIMDSYTPQGIINYGNNKNLEYPLINRIPFIDMMALSMMPPYISNIDDNFNVANLLAILELSPNDFGSPVFSEASNNTRIFPDEFAILESNPIQFYPSVGLDKEVSFVKLRNTQESKTMLALDNKGDILNLLRNKKAREIIKEWGTMPKFHPQADFTKRLESLKVDKSVISMLDQQNNNIFKNLDVQQFWAALSYLEQMKKGGFFSNADLYGFDVSGLKIKIMQRHKELMFKTVARQLNKMAKENVADFLEVPINKLKKLPDDSNGLAAYGVA